MVLVAWRLQNKNLRKLKEGRDWWQDVFVPRTLLGGQFKPRHKQVRTALKGPALYLSC